MNKFFAATALALACLGLMGPAAAQDAPAIPAPARFSVEIIGEGPDVILLPGLATPREVWRATADQLKGRYRVHLVQVRGFGEPAGANAEGPVLAPTVAELATYIQEQGLTRPAVIGHSLGGLAGLMLAADHPDLVGKLMIVDALPFYGTLFARPGMTITAVSLEPQARMIRDQLAASYGAAVDPRAAEANAAGQALTPAARAQIARWVAAVDRRVMGQLLYDDMTTDMRRRIAEVTTPITLVYPWNETYPSKAQAQPLYEGEYAAAPRASFVPIGPSGHFIMLDRPEEMRRAIEAFLRN